MSYRFEKDEGAGAGVRRIVLERLEHARAQLARELKEEPEEAVHTARKDLKKARSAIRLVREELGRKGYRRDNELLRDAGLALSDVRDAAVSIETLEKLREHFGTTLGKVQARAIMSALAVAEAPARGDPPEHEASQALELIERGQDDVEAWELHEQGWALLAPGVERAYERGRDALSEVESEATPERVHDLRKRVKDLWYYLRLFEEAWPQLFSGLAEQAHDLSNLLGDHHDLTVLATAVEEGELGLAAPEARALAALIRRRQDQLVAEALPPGRRLYAEKPRAFERRLGAYWEAWRA